MNVTVRPTSARFALVPLFILFLVAAISTSARPKPLSWDSVAAEDLAASDSKAHPGINSEILFSRESVEEDAYGLTGHNYVRAKIYTKNGVEASNILHIDWPNWMNVRDVAARVLKPEGQIIDLKKNDFREITIIKEKGKSLKRIAFAFPNLSPGDIIEYQWKTTSDEWLQFWRFCQEEIPVREFKFELAAENGAMISWQNCANPEPTGANTDKIGLTVRDLPPFKVEPYMPPERDLRGSIRLIYNNAEEKSAEKEWQAAAEEEATWYNDHTKASSSVKKKAIELIAGARTDEEKLRRLYTYCQSTITNLDWADAPDLVREREKLLATKNYQSPKELITGGRGLSTEIDFLFGALARAAKFQVFRARNADNDDMRTVGQRDGFGFLRNAITAVKIGEEYRFFDPTYPGVEYGMNHRLAEGSLAFVCDPKKASFIKIPESGPEKSVLARKARFTLSEDGLLTGEVVETFTGHQAERNKESDWRTPQADLERNLSDSIREHLPNSEISEAHWENLRGTELPVTLCYKLQVPDYAQKVGPRFIWPLNCFKVGNDPWFPAAERQYPIVFPFEYTEHDDIEIIIPDGYVLDHASAPNDVATPGDPIRCTYHLSYTGKRRVLKYERTFILGRTFFPAADYGWIRATFNNLNRSDTHNLVLVLKVPASH